MDRSNPEPDNSYINHLFSLDRANRHPSKTDYLNYSVGLDLGTASAGWAAITPDYRLLRIKGHDTIGVRLFDPAQTAADRRSHRAMRRRLSRRKWRLHFVDELFAPEINKIDPNFFQRRRYSWVHPHDQQNHDHFFGGLIFPTAAEDKEFYRLYPTMYHLRYALMGKGDHAITSKADIRLIYLAIHSMIKYRGNFLREGEISPQNVFTPEATQDLLASVLSLHFGEGDWKSALSRQTCENINTVLTQANGNRSQRVDKALGYLDMDALLNMAMPDVESASKSARAKLPKAIQNIIKAVFTAVEGNKADLALILNLGIDDPEQKKLFKFSFADEDSEENTEKAHDSGLLDDVTSSLLDRLADVYSEIALRQLLGKASSLSEAMVNRYNLHRERLQYLLSLCDGKEEQKEFRNNYEILVRDRALRSTTAGKRAKEKDNAVKYFKKFIENHVNTGQKSAYLDANSAMDLFPLQRGPQNGTIPHQLHLNELRRIIKNQQEYYPFLATTVTSEGKETNELESLLAFKIPYYVGPLVSPNQMQHGDNSENHWVTKKAGKENIRLTPWNYLDVIDPDTTARTFIDRLTDTDTYLLGKKTLPKHSLIYQEYEVLNELNNVRVAPNRNHLSSAQKDCLLKEMHRHTVLTIKRAEKVLTSQAGKEIHLTGLADTAKFLSSFSTYRDLSGVFGEKFVSDPRNLNSLEKIIEIQTVFEDRRIRRRQISQVLDAEKIALPDTKFQILTQRHYNGWGQFSRELLTTRVGQIRHQIGKYSILDALKLTDKNFMQIIHDQQMGFGSWIERENQKVATAGNTPQERMHEVLDDIRISPQVARGVTQAFDVVEDLRRATGHTPRRIFIEMADEPQPSTRTTSRYDQLKKLISADPALRQLGKELEQKKKAIQNNDKIFLYFIQQGKDMYSGKPLNIDDLENYDIDHIVPQAVTKDDSIENRVLIKKETNARKSDSLTYSVAYDIQRWWDVLAKYHFIGQKKLSALRWMASGRGLSNRDKLRFTARALVSTRQILKNVKQVFQAAYPSAEIIGASSELTKDMRRYLGFARKNRDINDYHHAQDALAMASAAQFAANQGFFSNGDIAVQDVADSAVINKYNRYLENYKRDIRTKATAKGRQRLHVFGFVVGSMRSHDMHLKQNSDGVLVWSDEDRLYLQHALGYKKMLVTRRIGDEPGNLWNATIQQAGKKKAQQGVAIKEYKDKDLYGFYDGQSTARIELVANQKGQYRLRNITAQKWDDPHQPTSDSSATSLLTFLPGQLLLLRRENTKGEMTIQPVRAKSGTEFNNARELWLPSHLYDLLDIAIKTPDKQQANALYRQSSDINPNFDEALADLFAYLCDVIIKRYPLCGLTEARADEAKDSFSTLPYGSEELTKEQLKNGVQTQSQVLRELIVSALSANAAQRNLSIDTQKKEKFEKDHVFFGSDFGRMHKLNGFILSPDDTFVFESPTGLFTQMVTVRELADKARR